MKQFVFFILLIGTCIIITSFNYCTIPNDFVGGIPADSTKGSKLPKKMAAGNFVAAIQNCSNTSGGLITKANFMALLTQPLCAKDAKTNVPAPVASFEINYCERSVSEDSTGLPIIVSECNMDPVNGDVFPKKWQKIFEERLYKGDTIKLEAIRVRSDIGQYACKNNIVLIIAD
jgi:hypothetical protein